MSVKCASKITVEGFISTDEFICEAQSRQDTSLFEPEYGAEGSREKDTFDNGKGDEVFSKGGMLRVAPHFGPLSFGTHCRHSLDCIKQNKSLVVVFNVHVNQQ